MKTCKECGVEKPFDDFYRHKHHSDGRVSKCKPCYSAKAKESYEKTKHEKKHIYYYHKNRDKIREQQNAYRRQPHVALKKRLKKYGIDILTYESMVSRQNNKCAICRLEFIGQPNIDHCHTSGIVRGLLCIKCNTQLAVLEDTEFVSAATTYLELHHGEQE